MERTIIGAIEKVSIGGKRFKARIDSGAKTSSLDKRVAKRLGLGPVVRKTWVRNVAGRTRRPVVRTVVKIRDKRILASFNLVDRSEMEFNVLIGRNILRKKFLVKI
jgi:hypothetical protein